MAVVLCKLHQRHFVSKTVVTRILVGHWCLLGSSFGHVGEPAFQCDPPDLRCGLTLACKRNQPVQSFKELTSLLKVSQCVQSTFLPLSLSLSLCLVLS